MEVKVSDWNTLPQQVQENMDNIQALYDAISEITGGEFKTGETMSIDW